MPTQISILPASTQAGRETIKAILASDIDIKVHAIYRDVTKAPAAFVQDKRFKAISGDVTNGETLDFSGSQAVLYVPPPIHDGTDTAEHARSSAINVKAALKRAEGVTRLVLHSAVGAHHENIGILKLNRISDEILHDAAPSVIIAKPGYFFEAFAHTLSSIKQDPPIVEVFSSPPDNLFPMVSAKEVGEYCAKRLLEQVAQPGTETIKVFGPRLYSALDILGAAEKATGCQGQLRCVESAKLEEYFAGHVPQQYAPEYAEMIRGLLPGGILTQEFVYDGHTYRGRYELDAEMKAWAEGA